MKLIRVAWHDIKMLSPSALFRVRADIVTAEWPDFLLSLFTLDCGSEHTGHPF